MLIKSYIICFLSYLIALLAAFLVLILSNSFSPLIALLFADLSATLVIFIIGTIYKNASLYDPYWSVFPLFIALYWIMQAGPENANVTRQVIVFLLISFWSLRLTFNWVRQWRGMNHEDWRYQKLRINKGKKFWFVNLTGIHIMPTLLVFLGSLSLFPSLGIANNPFNFLDIIAFITTCSAITIETIADQQLNNFIRTRESNKQVINRGLWKYSRHPNYFGEILFWWGLFLFALAANISYWWIAIGPISILVLFLVVSIPLIEERLENKPEYIFYKKNVSKLVLWFPKK